MEEETRAPTVERTPTLGEPGQEAPDEIGLVEQLEAKQRRTSKVERVRKEMENQRARRSVVQENIGSMGIAEAPNEKENEPESTELSPPQMLQGTGYQTEGGAGSFGMARALPAKSFMNSFGFQMENYSPDMSLGHAERQLSQMSKGSHKDEMPHLPHRAGHAVSSFNYKRALKLTDVPKAERVMDLMKIMPEAMRLESMTSGKNTKDRMTPLELYRDLVEKNRVEKAQWDANGRRIVDKKHWERDVSYLRSVAQEDWDQLKDNVPPTMIPSELHMIKTSAVPPTHPDVVKTCNIDFDEKDKIWHTTVFPSLVPAARREVLLLEKFLDEMLGRVEKPTDRRVDPLLDMDEEVLIVTMCFHEIVRQVSVQCVERGQLASRLWSHYLETLENIVTFAKDERRTMQKEIADLKEEVASLQNLKFQHQGKMEDMREDLESEIQKLKNELTRTRRERDKFSKKLGLLEHENRFVWPGYESYKKVIPSLFESLPAERRQLMGLFVESKTKEEEEKSVSLSAQQTVHCPECGHFFLGKTHDKLTVGEKHQPADELLANSFDDLNDIKAAVSNNDTYTEEEEDLEVVTKVKVMLRDVQRLLLAAQCVVTMSDEVGERIDRRRKMEKILSETRERAVSLEEELADSYNENDELARRIADLEADNQKDTGDFSQQMGLYLGGWLVTQAEEENDLDEFGNIREREKPKSKEEVQKIKKRRELYGTFAEFMTIEEEGKVLSSRDLLRTISKLYTARIYMYTQESRLRSTEQPFKEFVLDYYLREHGSSREAQLRIADLIKSVRQFSGYSPKIRLFGRFCGLLEDPMGPEALDVYLRCLAHMRMHYFGPVCSSVDYRLGNFWIPAVACIQTARAALNDTDIDPTVASQLLDRTERTVTIDSMGHRRMELDAFLQIMASSVQLNRTYQQKKLLEMFNKQYPLKDGLRPPMTFESFSAMIRSGVGEFDVMTLSRIAHEMLQESYKRGCPVDTLHPEVFTNIGIKYGIRGFRAAIGPMRIPENEDESLLLLEEIWATSKRCFVEMMTQMRRHNETEYVVTIGLAHRLEENLGPSSKSAQECWKSFSTLLSHTAKVYQGCINQFDYEEIESPRELWTIQAESAKNIQKHIRGHNVRSSIGDTIKKSMNARKIQIFMRKKLLKVREERLQRKKWAEGELPVLDDDMEDVDE